MKELQSLSGSEFDNSYMQRVLHEHSAALELFADAAWISDRLLAGFARHKLSAIRKHKALADGITARLAG